MSIRYTTTLCFLSLLFPLAGCESERPVAQTAAPVPEPTTQHAATETSPYAELNALDPRQPVPLQAMMAWHQKQSMQDHLVVVQQITEALGQEDWDAVSKASARIESSPAEEQMCRHMGAGAEGFTELALEFHHRADAIGVAAQAKDAPAVLAALAKTLASCTGCHAGYRQDVVTSAAWQAATGSDHEPSMHGH